MTEESFALASASGGRFWIETPQTSKVTTALLQVFGVSRLDDPGWMPIWILCGPSGAGRTALAERFAARVRSIVSQDTLDVFDADHERWRHVSDTPDGQVPAAVRDMEAQWDRFRTSATSSETLDRSASGYDPIGPWGGSFIGRTRGRSDDAQPVVVLRVDHEGRHRDLSYALAGHSWRTEANRSSDPLERTSMVFVDDLEHVVRFSETKRAQALQAMIDYPDALQLRHRVAFVLVGSPALAAAVAACRPVHRIDLPLMAFDGPDGTFGRVSSLIFGDDPPIPMADLHERSGGLIGPLLHIAHLQGLRAPYAWPGRSRPQLAAPQLTSSIWPPSSM